MPDRLSFIKYDPSAPTRSVRTAGNLTKQLWQELVALRYSKPSNIVSAPKAIAPWIDQARIYFLDASSSDWRSSGLLYYYSLLNLAKALLVARREITYKKMNTAAVYHGLSAELQSVKELTKFKVTIHPPTYNGRSNVFSSMYKVVTQKNWPYSTPIKIRLENVANYCTDISTELSDVFGIECAVFPMQSLLRTDDDGKWFFEILTGRQFEDVVKKQAASWYKSSVKLENMTDADKLIWHQTYQHLSAALRGVVILRGQKFDAMRLAMQNAQEEFRQLAYPNVYRSMANEEHWLFVPKIELSKTVMEWHPLLSNYLMAFVLSTVLRYQPQLLRKSYDESYYVAEAWCNQSAITAARNFLMLFTYPQLQLETY